MINNDITGSLGSYSSQYNKTAINNSINTAFDGDVDYIGTSTFLESLGLTSREIVADAGNWSQVRTAIEALINCAKTQLANFNTKVDIDSALEGDTRASVKTYIDECKKTLEQYIDVYQAFIEDADNALKQIQAGDTANSNEVKSGSQGLQQLAQDIKIN